MDNEYPESHPEQPHAFVRQWNRWICTVSGCHTMKTLERGVEYEDMTGRIDPFTLDVAPEDEVVEPEQTVKPKRGKTKEVNTADETVDDLTAEVN